MKYGLYISPQFGPEVDPKQALAEYVALVECARDYGFSSVLLAQHFLANPYQMLQAIPLVARLAPSSGSMTVGFGVLVAALLNPLEVAENSVTLDVITGGRFILGVGLGYRAEESAAFGLTGNRGRVFSQKLDVIRRLLSGEEVTAEGPGYKLDGARLELGFGKRSEIPIWVAANSEKGVLRAADEGDAWLIDPRASIAELEPLVTLYRDRRGEKTVRLPLIRETCVRESAAEAVELARVHIEGKYQTYRKWDEQGVVLLPEPMEGEWASFAQGRVIVGDPADAVEQVQRYQKELGVTDLFFRVQWPGSSHEVALETLRLLKESVIPRLEGSKAQADRSIGGTSED